MRRAGAGDVLVDQHLHGPADGGRVDAVELHREGVPLVGGRADHPQRLLVALDQRAGRDHLADVEAGAELAAQRAEGRVGDAGHRREHHGGVDRERAELQRRQRRRRRLERAGHAAQSRRRPGSPPRSDALDDVSADRVLVDVTCSCLGSRRMRSNNDWTRGPSPSSARTNQWSVPLRSPWMTGWLGAGHRVGPQPRYHRLLLRQVPAATAERVLDVGCGAGRPRRRRSAVFPQVDASTGPPRWSSSPGRPHLRT